MGRLRVAHGLLTATSASRSASELCNAGGGRCVLLEGCWVIGGRHALPRSLHLASPCLFTDVAASAAASSPCEAFSIENRSLEVRRSKYPRLVHLWPGSPGLSACQERSSSTMNSIAFIALRLTFTFIIFPSHTSLTLPGALPSAPLHARRARRPSRATRT